MVDNEPNSVEGLIARTEDYAKTSFELSKLKLLENAGTIISSMAATVVSAIIFLIALLIASFGLSIFLGELMGKIYYGFFVVAGGYVLIGIFFYFILNSRVKKSVSAALNQKLFN